MEAGDVIAGRYRLMRRLGEGAMGVVWAATNAFTDRAVALKLIPRGAVGSMELRTRMLREARACGRIQHRNVVEIYDVGQTGDGDPFLVMQLLRGETLEQRLRREGALAEDVALKIALSIARALAAAHAAGIVHRDLKPANVFLHREPDEPEMVVKVLDFGVSKVLVGDPNEATITGSVIGSPAYMSPEQARGTAGLEPRSDIWAFGALLFEMVAGGVAFRGDTAYEAVGEILHGAIPRLSVVRPGVDARLDAIVAACLQREVNARPSAANLIATLETMIYGEPLARGDDEPTLVDIATAAATSASGTSTTPMLRAPEDGRRTRVVVTASAIALFTVVAATTVVLLARRNVPAGTVPEAGTPSASETIVDAAPPPSLASATLTAPASSATISASPTITSTPTPKLSPKLKVPTPTTKPSAKPKTPGTIVIPDTPG